MATVALIRPAVPPAAGPIVICAVMLFVSGVIWALGGASPADVYWVYLSGSLAACGTTAALFVFIEVVKLAKVKAEKPIPAVLEKLWPKLPVLAIPALLLPLFLSAFTAAKSSMPAMVGFRFDVLFADLDYAIFGTDPWRITHSLIGPIGTVWVEFLYVPLWFAVLGYSKAMVAIFGDRRFAMNFFTAMMLTWFLGGFVFAYLLTSAGPTFVELNGMSVRFAELRATLLAAAGADSPFVSGPAYLLDGLGKDAYVAGGISAMPSMHIGACMVYCLAAKGTRWFYPALAFLVVTFVGSIHSGYHYAVDAPVAMLIAWVSWMAADRFYSTASINYPTSR